MILELAGNEQLARDLGAGGVFVPGCTVGLNEDCDLVVRGGGSELVLAARVVWIDPERGAGLQLYACDDEVRARITDMASAAQQEPEPEEHHAPKNVQERLRGLTLVEQLKVARHGELHERIALERIYGKNVWEALLRNPRLTGPEVARIARMGTLPRVMIELIVGNGAWLQIAEVRRALLTNPRLGTDQILRVLRLLSKPELKVAAGATVYPYAVRDAAKRLLRE